MPLHKEAAVCYIVTIMQPIDIIILGTPIALVLLIGFLKPAFALRWAHKFEEWAKRTRAEFRENKGARKKRQFAKHPFATMAVWVAIATRKFIPSEYWRVAVFLGVTATLFALFTLFVLTLVATAVYTVVVVVLSVLLGIFALFICLAMLRAFLDQESGGSFTRAYHATSRAFSGGGQQHDDNDDDGTNPLMVAAGGRGSRTYDGTMFGGNFVGYVDDSGHIYDNSAFGGNYIGHIDSNGHVYDGSGFGGNYIGHIDRDGNIYDGTGFGGNYLGRIENSGHIFDGGAFGGSYAGRAEKD